MNPRSGLETGRSFSFFASIARAARVCARSENCFVRAIAVTSVSLQLRVAKPTVVAHPERNSLRPHPSADFSDVHLAEEAFFPNGTPVLSAEGRRVTEYMRAANEDTANREEQKRDQQLADDEPATNSSSGGCGREH